MNQTKLLLPLLLLLTSSVPNQVNKNNIELASTSSIKLSSTTEESFNYEENVKGVVTCMNYRLTSSGLALQSFGTGFFFKNDKYNSSIYYYIMSNHHVIEGNTRMHILTSHNQEVEVTVVGYDEYQDVSVMRVEKTKIYGEIKEFDLTNPVDPVLGEEIYAIGTPAEISFGKTLNVGIVSGLNRIVVEEDDLMFYQSHAIQIDCAINGGNSGGPLLNKHGDVIGVNTLKLAEKGTLEIEGLNFSLPIHDMLAIINNPNFAANFKTRYGLCKTVTNQDKENFVSLYELDLNNRQKLGLCDANINTGVVILFADNILDAPIYSVICEIDGVNIKDVYDLRHILIEKNQTNKTVNIGYYEKTNNGYSNKLNKTVTLTQVKLSGGN